MVDLLRAVTTSPLYPRIRPALVAGRPDDVWDADEFDWLLVYALKGAAREQAAIFRVRIGETGERAHLVSAVVVASDGRSVRSEVIFDRNREKG